jgi:hypothetical protein
MTGIQRQVLTIANAATESTQAFTSSGYAAFGAALPSTFDGSAIEFTVSADDGTTYQTLYEYDPVADDGTTRKVTRSVTATRSYELPPALVAWDHFKIVAGTAQTGATDIVVIGKRP